MKRLTFILLTIFLMAGMVSARQQGELGVAGVLSADSPLAGRIEPENDMHLYTFYGAQGDVVTVQMLSSDGTLDPALVVLGLDGRLVGWNDDSNGELNATVEMQLPYDGTYFVLATTYRSLYEWTEAEGDYQILMTGASAVDAESGFTDAELPALEPDNIYEGVQVTGENPVLLSTLTVQDSLSIDLYAESESLDTVLYVFNTEGERIALDDDSSGFALSALLQGVPLDESGRYMVMVVTRGYERQDDRENINGLFNFYVSRSS